MLHVGVSCVSVHGTNKGEETKGNLRRVARKAPLSNKLLISSSSNSSSSRRGSSVID